MDVSLCQTLLDNHPSEALGVSLDGRIRFANRSATLLLFGERAFSPQTDFLSLWTMQRERVAALLRRCAGSSTWQPIALELASGPHSGVRVALVARGLQESEPMARDKGRRGHGSGEAGANGNGNGGQAADQDALTNSPMPLVYLVANEAHIEPFREHRRLVRRLNAELAEHIRLERQLSEALENQERLRNELVHRVKNNLAVISALIRARSSMTRVDEVRAALDEIGHRIQAVAIVHDILDRKKQIDIVEADELIERLCDQLESAMCPPGVSIVRKLESYPLHVEDATPLGLLINELVTNALKHAFGGLEAGQVEVTLKRNGVDKLEVHVADNGRGFREEESTIGSGSRIVRALAQQLRGTLTLEDAGGTSWGLIFPPLRTRSRMPYVAVPPVAPEPSVVATSGMAN